MLPTLQLEHRWSPRQTVKGRMASRALLPGPPLGSDAQAVCSLLTDESQPRGYAEVQQSGEERQSYPVPRRSSKIILMISTDNFDKKKTN